MDVSSRFRLTGGEVELVLYDAPPDAQRIMMLAQEEGLRLQRIFNLYDEESELSLLNRERSITASPELLDVVTHALRLCERTGGKYDISIGKAILERKSGRRANAPLGCSYRDIEVRGERITLKHPDAIVDLGSIAKGYIGDRILAFLETQGIYGFVDLRGDMRITGRHLEVVNIQHPRDEGTIMPFVLEQAAVATSGDYRQHYGSFDESHILGSAGLASVTVIAPTLMEADALATAAFVSGADGAQAVLGERKALLITTAGEIIPVNGWVRLAA